MSTGTTRTRTRNYTPDEVRRILYRCEGRPCPQGDNRTGHTLSRHVNISNEDLMERSPPYYGEGPEFDVITAYSSIGDAATAISELLNSTGGQDQLRQLDAGGLGTRLEFRGPVTPVRIRLKGGAVVQKLDCNTILAVVEADRDCEIFILTSFPLLGGLTRNEMWRNT